MLRVGRVHRAAELQLLLQRSVLRRRDRQRRLRALPQRTMVPARPRRRTARRHSGRPLPGDLRPGRRAARLESDRHQLRPGGSRYLLLAVRAPLRRRDRVVPLQPDREPVSQQRHERRQHPGRGPGTVSVRNLRAGGEKADHRRRAGAAGRAQGGAGEISEAGGRGGSPGGPGLPGAGQGRLPGRAIPGGLRGADEPAHRWRVRVVRGSPQHGGGAGTLAHRAASRPQLRGPERLSAAHVQQPGGDRAEQFRGALYRLQRPGVLALLQRQGGRGISRMGFFRRLFTKYAGRSGAPVRHPRGSRQGGLHRLLPRTGRAGLPHPGAGLFRGLPGGGPGLGQHQQGAGLPRGPPQPAPPGR